MKPYLNINHTLLKPYFEKECHYFNLLPKLKKIILEIGNQLGNDYIQIDKDIWIHKTTKLDSSTKLIGPLIIGKNSELRFSSFIRGNVIIGDNVIIGNSVEIKNSIIFDDVKVPHLSYIGDSILGYKVHIGAGTILSNCRLDKKPIKIKNINTNLTKLGSIIGEKVEIGCSCVLNPGTIIYQNLNISPLSNIKGIIKENTLCVE
jgi:NDP-sugar pyrophosphorylase family protein